MRSFLQLLLVFVAITSVISQSSCVSGDTNAIASGPILTVDDYSSCDTTLQSLTIQSTV